MPRNAPLDVLAIGETMVMLAPTAALPLDEVTELRLDIGGAESNVAMHLANHGYSVAWASRVGADSFGRRILTTIAATDVDVSLVTVDPDAPTGLYVKDPAGSRVHYYRANSAASRMSVEWLAGLPLASTRLVHVSGITPALSESCSAMVAEVISTAHRNGSLVSFDVNYRAPLWTVKEAAPVLLELARRADVTFVGRDEAERLWGTSTAADVRGLLPDVARLVVKDAEVGATEFSGSDETFVPSPTIEVVEPVGAGDAFAAGYLSALLSDSGSHSALEQGHAFAALALGSMFDVPRKG